MNNAQIAAKVLVSQLCSVFMLSVPTNRKPSLIGSATGDRSICFALQEGWTLLDVRPQSEHKKVTLSYVTAIPCCICGKCKPQSSYRPFACAIEVAELNNILMMSIDTGAVLGYANLICSLKMLPVPPWRSSAGIVLGFSAPGDCTSISSKLLLKVDTTLLSFSTITSDAFCVKPAYYYLVIQKERQTSWSRSLTRFCVPSTN